MLQFMIVARGCGRRDGLEREDGRLKSDVRTGQQKRKEDATQQNGAEEQEEEEEEEEQEQEELESEAGE
ncbi:hypothetical protein GTR04_2748 [Trichophyton interdigitale]|uniref:Uncharacterized protein n=1 Tax=Trichophyton interdigitale TaxID=101480 RepID=A0A9P4YN95_9EURO|nr:hypothetical protein GY631_2569 [Trichophyton interdigitale]KAF3899580.1 hypothetical protein GY632_1205 [Trichophyton interdigitale]KAG8209890.1 hypothetical protein GTR04_2748 [Trichophyton interdigitale]